MYNLVANALILACNGVAPDVEIAASKTRENGESMRGIAIRDRGPGVKPEHQQRIFGLLKRTVGRDVEEAGASLAIVQQVVRRHGKRIGSNYAKE